MDKREKPVSRVWLDLLVSEVSQETEGPQDHLDQMENLYVWDLILVILSTLEPQTCMLSVFITLLCSIQAREFSEEFIRQVCSDVLRSKFERLFTALSLFKVLKKFPCNYKDALLKARSVCSDLSLVFILLQKHISMPQTPYFSILFPKGTILPKERNLVLLQWVYGNIFIFNCYNTLSNFLFEFSQPSCLLSFRVEGYKTATTVSPKVLPRDFQGHQVQEALKVQEDFLVCQEMMVFQV